MSDGHVRVERDGFVAVVTIDRPKVNALNAAVIAELDATFAALETDDAVGAVVLTGAGEKFFVAGADIGELATQGVVDGKATSLKGQALNNRIAGSAKPIIAAVNGFALGGGLELALACDMRFASSNAQLGLPEVSLGIIPGYGGTQRLPRLVGSGKALELILTGNPVGAEEAHRIGLVNGVTEPGALLEHCKEVARAAVQRGPTAVAFAKQAVLRGAHLPMRDALEVEADLFGIISSTDEMKEGMAAFLEKRKPSWLRK
ncbi:MAG: enoyl-CoA hydratase-related protein [bacterium]|nr:enoyl-CoA hydratase-related protein [bacterium]